MKGIVKKKKRDGLREERNKLEKERYFPMVYPSAYELCNQWHTNRRKMISLKNKQPYSDGREHKEQNGFNLMVTRKDGLGLASIILC